MSAASTTNPMVKMANSWDLVPKVTQKGPHVFDSDGSEFRYVSVPLRGGQTRGGGKMRGGSRKAFDRASDALM
jgi:hypothetical protein